VESARGAAAPPGRGVGAGALAPVYEAPCSSSYGFPISACASLEIPNSHLKLRSAL